jgi:hypothetical protein
MLEALSESAKANKLVTIGSAVRKEDSFLSLIVPTFLDPPLRKKRETIILDPQAESIGGKLRNYCGAHVADQIVPVSACLEDSTENLTALISADS